MRALVTGLCALTFLAALTFLTACTGGTTDDRADNDATGNDRTGGQATDRATGEPSSGPTNGAEEGFFVEADTTEINTATQTAQDAFAVVTSAEQVERCNTAGQRGYGPWRTCFHRGLDPLVEGLDTGSAKLDEMSRREFAPACQEELHLAATVLSTQRRAVAKMLKVIDGPPGATQDQLAQSYQADVGAINDAVTAAYTELTQVCYSPADLASINASASPSGTR